MGFGYGFFLELGISLGKETSPEGGANLEDPPGTPGSVVSSDEGCGVCTPEILPESIK